MTLNQIFDQVVSYARAYIHLNLKQLCEPVTVNIASTGMWNSKVTTMVNCCCVCNDYYAVRVQQHIIVLLTFFGFVLASVASLNTSNTTWVTNTGVCNVGTYGPSGV